MEIQSKTEMGIGREEAPAKQSFIYKKNPQSANKAITRKLRQSYVPADESTMLNSNDAATRNPLSSNAKANETGRQSHTQHEAETIATQGHSAASPRGQAFS